MTERWNRREFLRGIVAGAAGMATGAYLPTRLRAAGRARARPGSADLPPRTVGLRTSGGDFQFDPVGLRVEVGETLTWLNMGDFHTSTAFHPDNADLLAGEVPRRIPDSAESFHSGMLGLDGGTRFDYTFRVEGVYDYFCQPHYSFGMVGRVIAGGPAGGPAVTRPLDELNEASRKQMPAVEEIMGPAGRTFEWAARVNGLLLLRAGNEDRSVEGAAHALRAEAEDDAVLRDLLSAAGEDGAYVSELKGFVDAAIAGEDYGSLVARADSMKKRLQAARAAGG